MVDTEKLAICGLVSGGICLTVIIIIVLIGSGIGSILLIAFGGACVATNDYRPCYNSPGSAIAMLIIGCLWFFCCCCSGVFGAKKVVKTQVSNA